MGNYLYIAFVIVAQIYYLSYVGFKGLAIASFIYSLFFS